MGHAVLLGGQETLQVWEDKGVEPNAGDICGRSPVGLVFGIFHPSFLARRIVIVNKITFLSFWVQSKKILGPLVMVETT